MIRRFCTELPVLKFPQVYPEDVENMRRLIIYRSGRTGTKETELLLKQWVDKNVELMSRDDLIQFHQEVLDQETVDLYQIMLGHAPHKNLKYLVKIREFVENKFAKITN